jgi:hypothetical protein
LLANAIRIFHLQRFRKTTILKNCVAAQRQPPSPAARARRRAQSRTTILPPASLDSISRCADPTIANQLWQFIAEQAARIVPASSGEAE